MTKPLLFDTDCLSAFLWVDGQSLLAALYPGRVVIPTEVYRELSNPVVPHLKARVDSMLSENSARVESIQTDSDAYDIYRKLTRCPDSGHAIIGRGEAAAIALAKEQDGILASNNLRDVADYVREYHLPHVTTGDIMKEALEQSLITQEAGDRLWYAMIQKRRRLGYSSFSDYLCDNAVL